MNDFLNLLRVHGAAYVSKNLSAPWGIQVERQRWVHRFHFVVSGKACVELPETKEQITLFEGDFAIVPHGASHVLKDSLETEAEVSQRIPDANHPPRFERLEQCSTDVHILCGFFRLGDGSPPIILDSLPSFLVLRSGDGAIGRTIELITDLIGLELANAEMLDKVILNRATDIQRWLRKSEQPG